MIVVDQLREYSAEQTKPAARRYGSRWCHLMTDGTRDELHQFAARLALPSGQVGLPRNWFQDHPTLYHYDLTPRLRTEALRRGAQEVDAVTWAGQRLAALKETRVSNKEKERAMLTVDGVCRLVQPYDDLAVECDGMTRVLHTVLMQQAIPHQVMMGNILYHPTQKLTPPHFWIELLIEEKPYVIDMRARLWLRKKPLGTIPHGLFQAEDYPDLLYVGDKIELATLAPAVFQQFLTQRYGQFIPLGYRTSGALGYLEQQVHGAQLTPPREVVETRFTPYASPGVPDAERWRRYGQEGLAATLRDHYHYFSNQTCGCPTGNRDQDRENWLGNRNYKKPGEPIELVNERGGLQMLHRFLVRGISVVAICGCPAARYNEVDEDDDRYSGCHLRYIANRLEEVMPGLPIIPQSVLASSKSE